MSKNKVGIKLLIICLMILFCTHNSFASVNATSTVVNNVSYTEFKALRSTNNDVIDGFNDFKKVSKSSAEYNKFIYETQKKLESQKSLIEALKDPATQKSKLISKSQIDTIIKNYDRHVKRVQYAVDPAEYDEADTFGPYKFVYRDSSGKVKMISSVDDLPPGSTQYRKIVEAVSEDDEFKDFSSRRRDEASMNGTYTIILDENSTKSSCYFSSYYKSVFLPIKSVEKKGSKVGEKIKKTIAHEYGHAIMDVLLKGNSPSHDYGPDNSHYFNEVTDRPSAFVEGWAEYLEIHPGMMEDGEIPERYSSIDESILRYEQSTAGDYKELNAVFSTYEELISSEGINALLLKKVSMLKDGNEKLLFESLASSGAQDLDALLSEFVKNNPDQAEDVVDIYDDTTQHKAPVDKLNKIFGKGVIDSMDLAARPVVSFEIDTNDSFKRKVKITSQNGKKVELDTEGSFQSEGGPARVGFFSRIKNLVKIAWAKIRRKKIKKDIYDDEDPEICNIDLKTKKLNIDFVVDYACETGKNSERSVSDQNLYKRYIEAVKNGDMTTVNELSKKLKASDIK